MKLDEELQAYNRGVVARVVKPSCMTPDALIRYYALEHPCLPTVRAYDGITREDALDRALRQLVSAGVLERWEHNGQDENGHKTTVIAWVNKRYIPPMPESL